MTVPTTTPTGLNRTLSQILKDATTSGTWWHQIAGYAALIVGSIDPGGSLSGNVQLAIVSFGSLIVGLDLFGKHQIAKASVVASAATPSKTVTITTKGA